MAAHLLAFDLRHRIGVGGGDPAHRVFGRGLRRQVELVELAPVQMGQPRGDERQKPTSDGASAYWAYCIKDAVGELRVSVLLSNRSYSPTRGSCYFAEKGWDDLARWLRTHATRF